MIYSSRSEMQLKRLDFAKPRSELVEHRQTLEDRFRDHPPRSTRQAAADIERLTGLRHSTTQGRKFLKGRGLKLPKVGTVPAKADGHEQVEYLDSCRYYQGLRTTLPRAF